MDVLIAVIATTLVVLLLLNVTSGEKKVGKRITPLYAVSDPRFVRSMGNLLGPSLQDGNRIDGLRNGCEILPAMLDAIRQARRTITFETTRTTGWRDRRWRRCSRPSSTPG